MMPGWGLHVDVMEFEQSERTRHQGERTSERGERM
jgi:hypothetical protein